MNNKQEAKFGMYRAVISFCNQHADVIASIPALKSAVEAFTIVADAIAETAGEKSKNITGVAADKTQLRKALTLLAASIASSVYAYATAVNDLILKARVKVTASDLLRLGDALLIARCQNIMKYVLQNLEALADYNVSQLTVNNFASLIKEYDASTSRPRLAATKRSAQGVSLTELFKDGDKILKMRVDKLIATLQSINLNFYRTYKSNRLITDPRTTPTQIKGTVINYITSEPLSGVTITIVENKTTVITGKDGRYVIKPVPHGKYVILAGKDGYHSKTIEGTLVKLGQVTTVNIGLVPVV